MRSCMEKRKVAFFGLAAIIAGLLLTASPSAAQPYQTPKAWKFGILSDTQWTGSPDDGLNPNSVAVNAINQINRQFIDKGVKLVVAVGDITDRGTIEALDTRAAFAQPLYNAQRRLLSAPRQSREQPSGGRGIPANFSPDAKRREQRHPG